MATPNDVSGTGPWLAFDLPHVWTDAGKTTAPSADGALIYTVADQSGGGFDATQSTSGSRMKWSQGDGFVAQEANVTQYMVLASASFNPTAFGICVIMEPLTQREGYDGSANNNFKIIVGNPIGSFGYYGDTGQIFFYDGSFRNIPLYVPTSRCCIIITGGASSVTIRVSGQQYVYGSAHGGSTTSAAWQIGGGAAGGFPVQGVWCDLVIKNHVFSAGDIAALESYAQVTRAVVFTPTAVVIVDGDSISYGALNTCCRNWVRQMRDAFPAGTLFYNIGQGGFAAQTATSQISSRVTPLLSSTLPTLYVNFLGTNDMALNSRTAAQAAGDVTTCLSQVKTAMPSARTMVCPMLPRSGFTDATRLAFNALLANVADAYCPIDALPAAQPGQAAYAVAYPDGIHPSDGTSGQIARIAGSIGANLLFGATTSQLNTLLSRLGAPIGASISADIQTRLATTSYTAPTNLTPAQIATGIWQDATAGDFTMTGSIGKSLFTGGAVPGAAGGIFIAGTNAATTVNITGSLSGSVGSVTGAVGSCTAAITLPSIPNGWITAAGIAASALNGKGDWSTYAGGPVASVIGNVGGNVLGSVGSCTAAVTVGANGDKTGYGLAANGLDSITVTSPATVAATFPQMIVQLFRRFIGGKTVLDANANTIKTYADDGTTVVTTQAATNNGGVQTVGKAS